MTERTHRGRAKRGPSQSPRGVRIIAGQWRGRRIPVAPATALRPTPDRVRETLFNWLMPTLVGSDCLDLFAGSGVLGWEALSRGAAQVCFVERDRAALQALKDQKAVFAAAAADIVAGDAEVFLKSAPRLFDVIFLDPPYDEPAEPWLEQLWSAWLAPSGCVYVERDSASALDALERFGHFRRRGRAAGVHYGLLEHRIERQD